MAAESIGPLIRWEDALSEEARVWVENRRMKYLPSYASLYNQGYRVVDELSPRSGRLLTAGKRRGMIQEMEANQIIEELKWQDVLEGRKREFDYIQGCVEPTRRDRRVATRRDIRAYKYGISILAREKNQQDLAADAKLELMIANIFAPRDEAVAATSSQQFAPLLPQVYA